MIKYLRIKYFLMQSGGGTGPMKPGNLLFERGANSCGFSEI
jgi:hypothetical protein